MTGETPAAQRGALPPARKPRPARSPAAASSSEPVQLEVRFDSNEILSRLLGQFDEHLALVENRLGIDTLVLGNVVRLKGAKEDCIVARSVLRKLYAQVAAGRDVTPGDFDGLIRHESRPEAGSLDTTGPATIATRKRVVEGRTPTQSDYIRAMHGNDLVFGIGPAGTGKTYLAVAMAASCLERGIVERLILSRPAVEAGERLGFLPGDMRDKVDPYLRPLYDALYDVLAPDKVEKHLETGVIEVAPLAFMRGRTLANAFVILDEAQNTTSMQMKMFLTRLGENAKMVVTGDPSQIDLPAGQKSGLSEAVALLDGVEEVQAVRFTDVDVVRRDLVARIVRAYDAAGAGLPPHAERQTPRRSPKTAAPAEPTAEAGPETKPDPAEKG